MSDPPKTDPGVPARPAEAPAGDIQEMTGDLSKTSYAELAVLFNKTMALDSARRRQIIDECDRPTLRLELEAMLHELDSLTEGFLAEPVATASTGLYSKLQPGSQVGRYKIVEAIGAGGMGEVFRAEQFEPIRRFVAIKVIASSWSAHDVERFRAERQAMAMLNHENVARIYDAGATADHRPYLVMELIDGLPINAHCDRDGLDLRERLQLFRSTCAGVEHAHQKGLIHRDLKPSNILVTSIDERWVPKVIDFGTAKSLIEPISESELTRETSVIGTIAYMAPEQLDPDPKLGIDTRADVYALGVVLFQMLCGSLPHERSFKRISDLLEQRIHDDPKSPTRAISSMSRQDAAQIAQRRGCSLEALERQLSGELQWICSKALAVDRDQRYASVAELAADIDRYLQDEPVQAGPLSLSYRATKTIRRHRAAVAAMTAIFLALSAGIVATSMQARRADREAAEARAATQRADREAVQARAATRHSARVVDFLVELFAASDPSQSGGETMTARELLDQGADRLSSELSDELAVQAVLRGTIGRVYKKLGLYEEALKLLEEPVATLADRELDSLRTPLLIELGEVYRFLGRFPDAEKVTREAMRSFELNDPEAALHGLAVHSLGTILWITGRVEEAELTYRRAIEINRSSPDGDPIQVARSLSNLGRLVASAKADFVEAEALHRQAVEIFENELGPDHIDAAIALSNLADSIVAQGRFEEGRELYERVLAIRERVLGPEHPKVAIGLQNLAEMLTDRLEAYDEAQVLYSRALTIFEGSTGEISLDAGKCRYLQGELELKRERPQRAEAHLRRALAIFESVLDPGHPNLAIGLSTLAVALVTQRPADDEARRLLERSVAIQRALGGSEANLNLALVLKRTAEISMLQGRYEAANTYFFEALTIFRRVFAADHKDLRNIEASIVVLFEEHGRSDRLAVLGLQAGSF